MKKSHLTLCICAVICWGMQRGHSQTPVSTTDVLTQVKEWVGGEPRRSGKVTLGMWEVEVYTTPGGRAFVDPSSKKIVMALIRPKEFGTEAREIKMSEALARAHQWMEQRGVSLEGWTAEGKYLFHRGSAGKEYMFYWTKDSPEGVQLPCLMSIAISGRGEVICWSQIEKPVTISLHPKISSNEAVVKAQSVTDTTYQPVVPPKLKVWFRDKQQVLWWEVALCPVGARDRKAIVLINAHTGGVTDVLKPLGSPSFEGTRQRYLQMARKVSDALKHCIRIEIWPKGVAKPILLTKPNSRFSKLLSSVHGLLQDGKGITGEPPYGLIAEFQLRFFITSDVAYDTKFSAKAAYFEVLDKIRVRREGGKEVIKRIESASVVVHKCPKDLVQQLLKQISG